MNSERIVSFLACLLLALLAAPVAQGTTGREVQHRIDSDLAAAKPIVVHVGDAAAGAYDRYQKCGGGAAKRLFWGAP